MDEAFGRRLSGGFATLLACLALAVPAVAQSSPGTGGTPLVGEWNWHDALMSVTIDLMPNGRYAWNMKTEGIDFPEKGAYQVEGDSLTLTRDGAAPQIYHLVHHGQQIVLTGGVFPAPRTFTQTPGSKEAVAAEQQKETDDQRAAAERQTQEDDKWRKRITLAPLNPAWHIGPVGEVPADPKPGHRFPHATVFKAVEGYTKSTLIGAPGANMRQTMYTLRWYFMPDGRVFANWGVHPLGSATDVLHPDASAMGTWAAYHVEPGESVDTVQLETDRGEKLTMKLEHGRRDLVFGASTFRQVQAANETLDRLLNSLK